MKSLLYVSKVNHRSFDAQLDIGRIVEGARSRNLFNDVSGMLVFTGDYFAQLLEGPAEAVDLIMGSIRADPRHHWLSEHVQPITNRSFGAWSLGYEGQSTYVDRLVRSLFAAPARSLHEAQAELQDLMLHLAHQKPVNATTGDDLQNVKPSTAHGTAAH